MNDYYFLQINQKSPPPAVPVLNLRPKNNGLLTTIEQAAMSDEEPSSPTTSVSGQGFETPPIHAFQGSSRIPTPKTSQTSSSTNNQPNYENVAGGRLNSESPLGSMIPKAKKTSLPIDRLSTANFVASNSNSPRKHSADIVSNRTLATPSPRPMLSSKIPVPGSHQK